METSQLHRHLKRHSCILICPHNLRPNIELRCMCVCVFALSEQEGCVPNPCLNGGVCRVYRRTPRCVCKDGFFGDRCQMCELDLASCSLLQKRCWFPFLQDCRTLYSFFCVDITKLKLRSKKPSDIFSSRDKYMSP